MSDSPLEALRLNGKARSAIFLFEIGVDAVTVFTFALATFRGITQYMSGV